MDNWKEKIQAKLNSESNKVAQINLEKSTVQYREEIKNNRVLKSLTGDEEIVRAFLIDRLVNELDYKAQNIETEKQYTIKIGHKVIHPRIDVIVKDNDGNPFFFIETKSPSDYEKGKEDIEGQLFTLAQEEEKKFNSKVRYLVYYTTAFDENEITDKAIIIDFDTYRTFAMWEKDGNISTGSKLTAGYDQPKKQTFIKGHDKFDLRVKLNKDDIKNLGKNLHNVLWGGGGTNDSEIFYSLVNIILAKIQDEFEKEDGQEYDFQIHQYGNNIESQVKIYNRINDLYKRALKDQLNITDQQKIDDDNIINRNKFPLNKLVYTVQSLESFSFLEGRSSFDGKDILGDFFESITRDGFKQNKGQFFTPTPIVNFLLYALQLDDLAINKLNSCRELPLIIDPSAGSGTYLVEAMKLITKEIKYKQKDKLKTSRQINQRFEELFKPDYNENKWAREYLYGSEINFDLGTSSKVNMILHGDGSTNIFVKDGLLPFRYYVKETSPNFLETSTIEEHYYDKEVNGKFDVAVSNPPFNVDLAKETQREIKNTFVFSDKKNSENLFIERYYQLLREGGRLGVVLPESIYDTSENKYIRLFLFKYFIIKAVISLPQLTFEPYTSTKTSLLFAQKKTKKQIKEWEEIWHKFGKEWSSLKTRVKDYVLYFVEEKDLNKKWAKDVINDIKSKNNNNILKNIHRFLKDVIQEKDLELEIKELLLKYRKEIDQVSKIEKENHVFGFYNAWWIFGEISKDLDYEIFMAEAKNIGYKRTLRGEKPMPNDLFDLEYAPNYLDSQNVFNIYKEQLSSKQNQKKELDQEFASITKKQSTKTNSTQKKKLKKISIEIEKKSNSIKELKSDFAKVKKTIKTYYFNDRLKTEFQERTDPKLIYQFKKGLLQDFASEDILLRKESKLKILDYMRQEIVWNQL